MSRTLIAWIGARIRALLRRVMREEIDMATAHQVAINAIKDAETRADRRLADLAGRVNELAGRIQTTTVSLYALERLEDRIAALQAIDVHFRDTGKIIVICRVDSRDLVRIIDIPAHSTAQHYREMIARIEDLYGARPGFVDAGPFDAVGPNRWHL